MNNNIFKDKKDYWNIANTIKDLYLSEGSITALLDFERVLAEMDLYAFANWDIGELVDGPDVSRYSVACTFMWPEKLMPDPRGAKRLLPFDCKVNYKKTTIEIPVAVKSTDDYDNGTRYPRLVKKKVWLVEIVIPKYLMNDIRTGSIELEDQVVDLQDLDAAYEQDLDQDQYQSGDDE